MAAAHTVIPLTGCPMTDYYAAMQVGGQSFQMLVDSGSTTLAVASAHCRSCGGLTPEYAPGNTAHDKFRTARSMYGDGSGWVGTIYSDVASFPGITQQVPVLLASITQQNHFFNQSSCILGDRTPNAYQGILGLGPEDLAVRGTNSFMQDLHAAGGNPNNVFAVQLCDLGGKMWLGGYDTSAATGPAQYTRLDPTSPFYAIDVADLHVAGSSVGASSGDYGAAVVDTGTTVLMLTNAIYSKVVDAVEADPTFQQEIGGSQSGWFNASSCNPANSLSRAELDAKLPRLTFQFPGTDGGVISVDAAASESYLLAAKDQSGTLYYCAGLAEGMQTILGGAFLRSHIAVFDVGAGRMGFAPHNSCAAL